MAVPPPPGFHFVRRWWAPLTLLCLALFLLFLFRGWFWFGILATSGWLYIALARFTKPPHDF